MGLKDDTSSDLSLLRGKAHLLPLEKALITLIAIHRNSKTAIILVFQG